MIFQAAIPKYYSSLLGLFLDFCSGAISLFGLEDEELCVNFGNRMQELRILKDGKKVKILHKRIEWKEEEED